MKLSEQWLRTLSNPKIEVAVLTEQLTMAGLELESLVTVAPPFEGVVVGEIMSTEKHPDADKLTLCELNVGEPSPLKIICGAKNVVKGGKVAVAMVGAKLPFGINIKKAKMRGVESHGMLCAWKELGLDREQEGIAELSLDAPVGKDVRAYLELDDNIIDLGITPNRGDCLSVLGVAREVAIANQLPLPSLDIQSVDPLHSEELQVILAAPHACSSYAGCIIQNVDPTGPTPHWLQERLQRSGIRSLSLIVDICNYVMLELGQPLHAFDLEKIHGDLTVRFAKKGESLTLLDDSECTLGDSHLIIADEKSPLALAGIMGGKESGVEDGCRAIFLESAYFDPENLAKTLRELPFNSESSYRFERGVDSTLQARALSRAIELIVQHAGGEAGPVTQVTADAHPKEKKIKLRFDRLQKLLGFVIPVERVDEILNRLSMPFTFSQGVYEVRVPAYRHDVCLEVDLIEEVVRVFGYHNIPMRPLSGILKPFSESKEDLSVSVLQRCMVGLGYHEVITYSFVDPVLQDMISPEIKGLPLTNPMSSEMAVMRTSLWPGLLSVLKYNRARQVNRIRLFETGMRFREVAGELKQEWMLSGIVIGEVFEEQWGENSRALDFYDVKHDVESLLKCAGKMGEGVSFQKGEHSALHPGQTAEMSWNGQPLGVLGKIHPSLASALSLPSSCYLFECELAGLQATLPAPISLISKFPEIRRDVAFWVDDDVEAQRVMDSVREVAGDFLTSLKLFDYYKDSNSSRNKKSLAIALTLQHPSRTLIDEEVVKIMERVHSTLKNSCNAELRE
jgi:phenylalanyl-tRNA synthetase beta chain